MTTTPTYFEMGELPRIPPPTYTPRPTSLDLNIEAAEIEAALNLRRPYNVAKSSQAANFYSRSGPDPPPAYSERPLRGHRREPARIVEERLEVEERREAAERRDRAAVRAESQRAAMRAMEKRFEEWKRMEERGWERSRAKRAVAELEEGQRMIASRRREDESGEERLADMTAKERRKQRATVVFSFVA